MLFLVKANVWHGHNGGAATLAAGISVARNAVVHLIQSSVYNMTSIRIYPTTSPYFIYGS